MRPKGGAKLPNVHTVAESSTEQAERPVLYQHEEVVVKHCALRWLRFPITSLVICISEYLYLQMASAHHSPS